MLALLTPSHSRATARTDFRLKASERNTDMIMRSIGEGRLSHLSDREVAAERLRLAKEELGDHQAPRTIYQDDGTAISYMAKNPRIRIRIEPQAIDWGWGA